MNEFNATWTPTVYTDGGDLLHVGGSESSILDMITQSSQREVPPLDLVVKMDQIGDDTYDITVRIGNEVPANSEPSQPAVDAGPSSGQEGIVYEFETTVADPDEDELYYQWDWGDGKSLSAWLGPYASGETCVASHAWAAGDYEVKVRTKDSFGAQTDWSAGHPISVQCCVVRGNVDDDAGGVIDISDFVYLIEYMFLSGPEPPCTEAANIDGDVGGAIEFEDLVYMADFMFVEGPQPPACPQ